MAIKQQIVALLLIIITLFTLISSNDKVCHDHDGKEVDWWVVFLFPETSSKEKVLSYGYYDNNSKTKDLTYYKYDQTNFPPILLIKQVETVTEKDPVNYFFWNDDLSTDEKSASAGSGKAHSKGGLSYSSNYGFHLLHSLPRFPKRNSKNEFETVLPDNAGKFGQTYLCLSLDKTNILKMVENLNIINPKVMLMNGDNDNVDKDNAQVLKLIKNRGDSNLPDSQHTDIVTRKNKKFTVFSKGKDYDELPYDTLIPDYYKDSFYVETWTKPAMLPSKCKGSYEVVNVQSLKFGHYSFDMNQEHSKWAVSQNKNIACFGDLNRTESQKKRGGMTICFENRSLANIMRNAIVDSDKCKVKKALTFLQ
jgi:deoxyribonuclease-2